MCVYVCVCVGDVDCWLWVISTSLRVNGPLRWGFVGNVFLCRPWGLITNNSCLTFSRVSIWNARDVRKGPSRTVAGRSMSHHLHIWFAPYSRDVMVHTTHFGTMPPCNPGCSDWKHQCHALHKHFIQVHYTHILHVIHITRDSSVDDAKHRGEVRAWGGS